MRILILQVLPHSFLPLVNLDFSQQSPILYEDVLKQSLCKAACDNKCELPEILPYRETHLTQRPSYQRRYFTYYVIGPAVVLSTPSHPVSAVRSLMVAAGIC